MTTDQLATYAADHVVAEACRRAARWAREARRAALDGRTGEAHAHRAAAACARITAERRAEHLAAVGA